MKYQCEDLEELQQIKMLVKLKYFYMSVPVIIDLVFNDGSINYPKIFLPVRKNSKVSC